MSEIRWLDDEEQRTWRAFLSATRLLWAQLDRELQAEAAMPNSYYAILVLLSEAPERALRMNDLAEATQSSPSRMSHAIGRLEKAGWVRRESCPNDRRGWYAVLTDEGMATLEAAAPKHLVERARPPLRPAVARAALPAAADLGVPAVPSILDRRHRQVRDRRRGPSSRAVGHLLTIALVRHPHDTDALAQ